MPPVSSVEVYTQTHRCQPRSDEGMNARISGEKSTAKSLNIKCLFLFIRSRQTAMTNFGLNNVSKMYVSQATPDNQEISTYSHAANTLTLLVKPRIPKQWRKPYEFHSSPMCNKACIPRHWHQHRLVRHAYILTSDTRDFLTRMLVSHSMAPTLTSLRGSSLTHLKYAISWSYSCGKLKGEVAWHTDILARMSVSCNAALSPLYLDFIWLLLLWHSGLNHLQISHHI